MNRKRLLSLFSGIGGFDLGLERAGMECAGQVEIDEKCQRVLARHWPDVPRIGDVRDVQGDEFGPVGLVCGGSPCQDLSVAGRGAGLVGRRSGLFYNFVRIADEKPGAWVLFENVPGLLSIHRGRDFSEALFQLTGFRPSIPKGGWRNGGVCVGPKRTACWRVLDAQYFGLAQRRKRVFIVCGPGDGRGPVSVLFEPKSCSGDPQPKREKGTVAPTLFASGAGTSHTASAGSEADFCIVESQTGLVRRLTPVECCRLQGFPDDHLRMPEGEKQLKETTRYRMLGNAVAVPVVEWIGRRIVGEMGKP